MSIFYWTGYVLGWLAMASPLLLLVPTVRRRWVTRPLLRKVTGRQPWRVAARIDELERTAQR